jgi:hypothetical protein
MSKLVAPSIPLSTPVRRPLPGRAQGHQVAAVEARADPFEDKPREDQGVSSGCRKGRGRKLREECCYGSSHGHHAADGGSPMAIEGDVTL